MDKLLRSQKWFGKSGKDGFIYRSWMKKQGFPQHEFVGKPVIGICNTWSELTPCNSHFRGLADAVKRGVWEAGGLPLEFPVMSLGETLIRPTAMLYRNLVSMDVEETIRANPIDGVVLLGGCDKTTPALVMGAASVNIPTIVVSGGSMLTGNFHGQKVGTSDVWRFNNSLRRGQISQEVLLEAESDTCRSAGHCAVMGTASTMACMVESLGLSLPGNAAIPASDSRRISISHLSGNRIVEMVKEKLIPSKILTRKAFENSIIVNAAIGGSTNFVLHLLAIAGRIGVTLCLDDFDIISSSIPLIANIQPSGEFFMEDFFYAGGLPSIIRELQYKLHSETITVTGNSLIDNCRNAPNYNPNIIRTLGNPIKKFSGIVVLKGNICPNGAVIKPSAASPKLLQLKGSAIVFKNIEDYKARIDDPNLEIMDNSILVLKQVGPVGYPGMPEVGNFDIPKKMLARGISDIVRISDGRMSGTGFGTVILHVAPESAIGGAFALVQDGDMIFLDVMARKLELLISEVELQKRRENWKPDHQNANRGYIHLFQQHVLQADKGVDFDFLVGESGSNVPRDSH